MSVNAVILQKWLVKLNPLYTLLEIDSNVKHWLTERETILFNVLQLYNRLYNYYHLGINGLPLNRGSPDQTGDQNWKSNHPLQPLSQTTRSDIWPFANIQKACRECSKNSSRENQNPCSSQQYWMGVAERPPHATVLCPCKECCGLLKSRMATMAVPHQHSTDSISTEQGTQNHHRPAKMQPHRGVALRNRRGTLQHPHKTPHPPFSRESKEESRKSP